MNNLIPIIICGGSGTRLWPVSNKYQPKQFIKFFSEKSLFDMTIERSSKLSNFNPIIVASKENKKFIQKSLLKNNSSATVIYEEIARNTTAAIIFGLQQAKEKFPKSSAIIMPSDHFISNNSLFKKDVKKGMLSVDKFSWFLFGVSPTSPKTGYGYIKSIGKTFIKKIDYFIEKPNSIKAKKLIEDPDIFWNSGIFLGKVEKLLQSIEDCNSNIYKKSIIAWNNRKINLNDDIILKKSFLEDIKNISIDKSVLEKEVSKALVPLSTKWSDIGSWDTLSEIITNDRKVTNNSIEINSKENFIFSPENVVLIGVENLIIINFKDKLLIMKKGESEKVKKIYQKS